MKKNLYYRNTLRRENMLKVFILSLFSMFASYPRLLLEVFIRKNFGERYFKLSSALTVAFVLALCPYLWIKLATLWFRVSSIIPPGTSSMLSNYPIGADSTTMMSHSSSMLSHAPSLWPEYLTWYIFLILFVLMSIKHYFDIKRNPSVFDFAKFSLYAGKINPLFFKIKNDPRLVECLIEPAVFFVVGFVLHFVGQKLGGLLIFCSVVYALSYAAAYWSGDNFVMDKIDEIICNEELEKAFVDDSDEDKTRGFRFRGKKPQDHDMRKKILPSMTDVEEIVIAK